MMFYENGKLNFNTQLTQSGFTKARFSDRLNEQGLLAEKIGEDWNFSPYEFSGTYEKDNYVFLEGNGFAGRELSELISSEKKETRIYSLSFMITLLEKMVSKKVSGFNAAPASVFVSDDFSKVIFLPALFFKTALSCMSIAEKNKASAFFINPLLKGKAALKFTQGVFAYLALTEKLPYENPEPDGLSEDIRDADFVHLENLIYGLTPQISRTVDSFLSQNMSVKNHAEKKQAEKLLEENFPLDDFYAECGLTKNGTLNNSTLLQVKRSSVLTHEQFEKRAAKSEDKRLRALNKKRFIRKHSTTIAVCSAAAVVCAGIMLLVVSSWRAKPTTKGLTSFETAEYYYSSVNALNPEGTQYSTFGKKMKQRDDAVSGIYVSTKAVAAYDAESSVKDFTSWLYGKKESFRIFGLSQFKINGKEGFLYRKANLRSDSVLSVLEEDGEKLFEGKTKSYPAEYFLVDGTAFSDYRVKKCSDIINLIYHDERWLVESIDSVEEEFSVSEKDFISDYKAALVEASGDIYTALALLREKYSFIPTNEEIKISSEQ
ncbi:MAG: hypothetical protein J6Z17_05525 [Treponema sp.]|nr:hypothetical protein [Treponema sp.]